jgi:hypothetical protein
MGILFGAIGVKDSERPFTSIQGQRLVWDETNRIFDRWNQEFEDIRRIFVQSTTTEHKLRYELAAGGEAEAIAFEETDFGDIKRTGSWDVAWPILVTGSKVSRTRVSRAYMSMGQWEANIQTVLNVNNNTQFRRILTAIFKNTNTSFTDPVYGTLTVMPLANQDGVLYPPLLTSSTEAQENYYQTTTYVETAISNANNPFSTLRDLLEPRWGFTQGGSNIVIFVAPSAMPAINNLADFIPSDDSKVMYGDDITRLSRFPGDGEIMNIARVEGTCNGCWVVSWARMPANYMIARDLTTSPPLMARIDDVPGLGDGSLQLIHEDKEEIFPSMSTRWVQRIGYGVGNRLGAVVLYLGGAGSYTAPTGYATFV